MDIEPVSLSHFQATADGRMVQITDDVLDVARDVQRIGRERGYELRLRWSEAGQYFVVYQVVDHGGMRDERFVLSARQLDGRVVERVRQITHDSYDVGAELERIAVEGKRERREQAHAAIQAEGDRIAHAMRHVTRQPRTRVFVP